MVVRLHLNEAVIKVQEEIDTAKYQDTSSHRIVSFHLDAKSIFSIECDVFVV